MKKPTLEKTKRAAKRHEERREEREAEAWDALVHDLEKNTEEEGTHVASELSGDGTKTWKDYTMKEIIKQAFSLKADTADYQTIQDRLEAGGHITGTNLSVLFFAILIASIGLNLNSTAVIIGAMLISPLMGTIQLMGLSIATVDGRKFRAAFIGFLFQVLTALLTSTLYFLISPLKTATSELLGRTSPSVYDVLIATFGGLAGIIAMTRKDATSNVVPGVAIATALMPPLCTCGYALANAHWSMLGGAALLFTINTMFILVAAVFVLIILEVPEAASATPELRARMRRMLIRNATVVLAATVLLTVFATVSNDDFNSMDSSPVTSKTVSTERLTNEIKVLFPEVETLQAGQTEEVDKDGKLVKQNVLYLGLSEPLEDERKDLLNRFVDAAYDEEITIVYQDLNATDTAKTQDLEEPNGK